LAKVEGLWCPHVLWLKSVRSWGGQVDVVASGAANSQEFAELCRWPMDRIKRDSVRRVGV
jgi:hypothetical protein